MKIESNKHKAETLVVVINALRVDFAPNTRFKARDERKRLKIANCQILKKVTKKNAEIDFARDLKPQRH